MSCSSTTERSYRADDGQGVEIVDRMSSRSTKEKKKDGLTVQCALFIAPVALGCVRKRGLLGRAALGPQRFLVGRWSAAMCCGAVVLRLLRCCDVRAKVRVFVLGFLLLLQTLEARRRPKPRHLDSCRRCPNRLWCRPRANVSEANSPRVAGPGARVTGED